jgi:hypothetical protein
MPSAAAAMALPFSESRVIRPKRRLIGIAKAALAEQYAPQAPLIYYLPFSGMRKQLSCTLAVSFAGGLFHPCDQAQTIGVAE